MRFLYVLILGILAFTQCKNFGHKKDYGNLPQDSAQFMIWCDALAKDSNNSEVLFLRAGYFAKKHQYIRALADANKATIIDTTKSDYFLLLGDICFAVNKTKIAALAYERAIVLDKENYAAFLKLGQLYYIVKEHPSSLRNYDEALKITSNCEECYFFKGLNYREMIRLENHDELAIAMFQKAISLNPNFYEAYIQLGELNETKNTKLALEYFNAALRLQPKSIEALYHRGYHYQMINNFDSAGADYKRILEINQTYLDAYFNVAFMNMQQGKWETAIEGFKIVVKLNENNEGGWLNLGKCYENTRKIDKAKKAYFECLRINKENSEAISRLRTLK